MKRSTLSYFIELLIVIFGVSIAFWLGQKAEEKRENVVRRSYLSDIKLDLQNDIQRLDQVIEFNTKKRKKTYDVAQLFPEADSNKEVIIQQVMEIGSYDFFSPKNFTYQSMIASGDFKLIANRDIKKELIMLHSAYDGIDEIQRNYMQALDDSYFPFVMDNFDYTTFNPTNTEFHKSLTVKNFFMYTVNDLGSHLSLYKYAKISAQKLDSLIGVELKQ